MLARMTVTFACAPKCFQHTLRAVMPRYRRCVATTTKGKRCRKLVPQEKNDMYCGYHRKRNKVRVRTNVEPSKKGGRARKALDITYKSAAAVVYIYEILHYLLEHWHEISPHFHGINISFYRPYWNTYQSHCEIVIDDPSRTDLARTLVGEFNEWFADLPSSVQSKVRIHFGQTKLVRLKATSKALR